MAKNWTTSSPTHREENVEVDVKLLNKCLKDLKFNGVGGQQSCETTLQSLVSEARCRRSLGKMI